MLLTFKSASPFKLISKNSLCPKILEQATAILLTQPFFALWRAQSSQVLNIPVRCTPIALPVAWMITSEGWPRSLCSSLTSLLVENLADWALLWPISWRNSTTATQPSWVLILLLGWYCLYEIVLQCCYCGCFLSCSPAKVFVLGNAYLHMSWCNTSQAIECVSLHCCQLGGLSCDAFLSSWWTYYLHYPVPNCWSWWHFRDQHHFWWYDVRCQNHQSMHFLWKSSRFLPQ